MMKRKTKTRVTYYERKFVLSSMELYQQLATFWVEAWKKCLWWVPEKVEKKEEERN
jgi:hypothetical protein